MAYNLESLRECIEQILHPHPRIQLDSEQKPLLESLLEKVIFLKQVFKDSAALTGDGVKDLELGIRDAAHDAEDVIESHLVDHLLLSCQESHPTAVASSEGFRSNLKKMVRWLICSDLERRPPCPVGNRLVVSTPDLNRVMKEFDDLIKEAARIRDRTPVMLSASSSPVPWKSLLNRENVVVDIDEELFRLKDRITENGSDNVIICIVGKAGIGKTTLAQNLYIDQLIVEHFDTRAWINISTDLRPRQILLDLLNCILMEPTVDFRLLKTRYLGDLLYKTLMDRRYLVVFDDVWARHSWNALSCYIPHNNNGSCVIVTTRELSMANYVGGLLVQMNFLNEVQIWKILCRKVFGEETCPEQLEEIGGAIAHDCRGLPLAAHVIGGILTRLERTPQAWDNVARGVCSFVTNIDDEQLMANILRLSCNDFPSHLKHCLLYMAAFPKDYEIQASKLIKLWVVEGFLTPTPYQSLEDIAEQYLKELIDRHLISVQQWDATKKSIKSCIMHDIVRSVCIAQAQEENFFHLNMTREQSLPLRRVGIIEGNIIPVETPIYARTILCFHDEIRHWTWEELRLLRVLDILQIIYAKFPEEILKLINLRYLAASFRSMCALPISMLCNLQTIHLRHLWYGNPWTASEASRIFMIPRLRHIKFEKNYPEFYPEHGQSFALQEDLQSLIGVKVNRFLQQLVEATPNLQKLGIEAEDMVSVFIDLTCLSKLVTLKCSISYMSDWDTTPLTSDNRSSFLSRLIFPPFLKKLSLYGCTILEGQMDKIAKLLHNLKVLKLDCCEFENEKWVAFLQSFQSLTYLQLKWINLVNWIADSRTCYPVLRHLSIQNCWQLKEIPIGFGGIHILELIELKGKHRASALDSAWIIRDVQHAQGNDAFQVRITFE